MDGRAGGDRAGHDLQRRARGLVGPDGAVGGGEPEAGAAAAPRGVAPLGGDPDAAAGQAAVAVGD